MLRLVPSDDSRIPKAQACSNQTENLILVSLQFKSKAGEDTTPKLSTLSLISQRHNREVSANNPLRG